MTLRPRTILLLLVSLVLFQALTTLFWLPISAHSGQTAIPWMMNEGMVLFGNILEQHAPGTSLVSAFAQRISPFDIGTTVRIQNSILVIVITLCCFDIARKLTDADIAGLLAAAIWVLLAPAFANVLFYFNTLLIGCILLALVIFLRIEHMNNPLVGYFFTGLFMGAATLAKQHAWAAVGFLGLWLLWQRTNLRAIVTYSVGALLLPAIVVGVITLQGNLANYIYWNWTFNLSGYMDSVALNTNFFRKLLLTNILVLPFWALIPNATKRNQYILLTLMYGASLILLYPRAGESAAISHIPLVAIMSAIVLYELRDIFNLGSSYTAQIGIMRGIFVAILIGWLWGSLVAYIPSPVHTPAYDEFDALADAIQQQRTNEADTLFVLPETDSTPQLHMLTEMKPPNTWIKGWRWYLEPDGILETLLDEWSDAPPALMVVFPSLLPDSRPAIDPLVAFVEENYTLVETIPDVVFHGEAQIYQYSGSE